MCTVCNNLAQKEGIAAKNFAGDSPRKSPAHLILPIS